MAQSVTASDLRGLSRAELNKKVVELKEELFSLRFQAAKLPGPFATVKDLRAAAAKGG